MSNAKYDWELVELVDVDIRAGMPDRAVSEKYGIPYVTIQHHRWEQLGIPSPRHKTVLRNRPDNYVPTPFESKNPYIIFTVAEIRQRSHEQKRKISTYRRSSSRFG
jgi:hypothetical protein